MFQIFQSPPSIFLAGEPDRFASNQTGLMWILTPIKSGEIAWGAFPYPEHVPWYYVGANDSFVDLRVVAIEVLVLLTLMIVVPLLSKRHSRSGLTPSLVTSVGGLLFGMAIAAISPSAGGSPKLSIVYFLGTASLFVASISIIVFRFRTERPSRLSR
jgi:hypothetical protein